MFIMTASKIYYYNFFSSQKTFVCKNNLNCILISVLERVTFERLLGPCLDILRREIDGYRTRLSEVIKNSDI